MTGAVAFLLRRITDQPRRSSVYTVLLDGLAVGEIGKATGVDAREFWYWRIDAMMRPVSGTHGEAQDRDAAMAAFRAAWAAIVTADDLERMRAQAEWTAQKYALWDQGLRGQPVVDAARGTEPPRRP